MAKVARIVVKLFRDPVQVLRYDRAARGRLALIDVLEVDSADLRTFLHKKENQEKLNVKSTRQ